MKAVVALLFLLFASAGSAQTISVQSGEHNGFTRLVFTFPKLGEWSLMRSNDGYDLSVAGGNPTYDLSNVFRRISSDRLARISTEPTEGVLKLVIACTCFAMPFELEKGILVIDIKDGAPPQGSSFEVSKGGDRLAPLVGKTQAQPRPRPKDATIATADTPAQTAPIPPTLSNAINDASRLSLGAPQLEETKNPRAFDQARQDLLWQLSKGAASGIVDIEVPVKPTTNPQKQAPPKATCALEKILGWCRTPACARRTG